MMYGLMVRISGVKSAILLLKQHQKSVANISRVDGPNIMGNQCLWSQPMEKKADLRNLGECLGATFGELRRHGIQVDDTQPIEGKPVLSIVIYPAIRCPTCHRISPAAACLWCTPAEEETK